MASHTCTISISLHNLDHFTKAVWEKLSLHPHEPKLVQTEQFVVFPAGMGKDPVLPYVKVPASWWFHNTLSGPLTVSSGIPQW